MLTKMTLIHFKTSNLLQILATLQQNVNIYYSSSYPSDLKYTQIVFGIEIEILVKIYSRYLNQRYSSRCLLLVFVKLPFGIQFIPKSTVFQVAMFTNTK